MLIFGLRRMTKLPSSPPLDDEGVVDLPVLVTVVILDAPAALDSEVSIDDVVVARFVDDVISKETSELFAILLVAVVFSADHL